MIQSFDIEQDDVIRAVFYGLGSDGTVGANKNSTKIIGENTNNYAQAYFVYDSKKAGAVTVSHLRFGPRPIHDTYLISRANFVACHQFQFLERFDMLAIADQGATFLLNSPFGPDEVWDQLPRSMQEQMIAKDIKFYVVDGYEVAKNTGMGRRINTIMQTCFFSLMEQVTGKPILPARRSYRRNQSGYQEDIRQARRTGRTVKLRRRGRSVRAPVRSGRSCGSHQHL